jgi:hypothetical protein
MASLLGKLAISREGRQICSECQKGDCPHIQRLKELRYVSSQEIQPPDADNRGDR